MSFALDAVLIIICILCVVVGTKRGFFKTLMSLISAALAAFAAYVFSPSLAAVIRDKFILDPITNGISKTVRSLVPQVDGSYDLSGLFKDMPQTLGSIIERYHGDRTRLESIANSITDTSEKGVDQLSRAIAEPIVNMISAVIAFALIFIAVFIILKIVTAIIDSVFKLPVLNGINTFLGFALSVVLAGFFVVIYTQLCVNLVVPLGSISPELFGQDVIDKTLIVKFFSEHSITDIVGELIKKI